jgi:hypothetical protein
MYMCGSGKTKPFSSRSDVEDGTTEDQDSQNQDASMCSIRERGKKEDGKL